VYIKNDEEWIIESIFIYNKKIKIIIRCKYQLMMYIKYKFMIDPIDRKIGSTIIIDHSNL
jgi:hypothetical protein